jgi:hypothetical protein
MFFSSSFNICRNKIPLKIHFVIYHVGPFGAQRFLGVKSIDFMTIKLNEFYTKRIRYNIKLFDIPIFETCHSESKKINF